MWGRRICYLPITVKLRLGRSGQKQVEKILRNKSNRPQTTKIKTSRTKDLGRQEKKNLDVTLLIGTFIILVLLHDIRR
jgi:hypothetical protein